MRILVCSLDAPLPPPNGLRLQVSALVRELRKDHEVSVLALLGPDQDGSSASEGMHLVPRGATASPARAAGLLGEPLRRELERFRPEIVHVTSGRLARLGRMLRGRPAVLAALDAWHLNVESEAYQRGWTSRARTGLRTRMVKRFERSEYARFARVVVVSEEDRRALLEVQPTLSIEVVPNGVDADAFDWDGTRRDRNLILFTGVMSYAPNVTAAEFLAHDVLTKVQSSLPGARLALVGRDPHPAVRAIAAARPGVEVAGEVPDMRPWLSRAGAYACPMLTGTGMKNKLLEAMANGLPCVATPLALHGLTARPGEEILAGSSPDELAEHLVHLLGDEELAERIGSAGRSYVRAHHTWSSVAAQYLRIYREVASRF